MQRRKGKISIEIMIHTCFFCYHCVLQSGPISLCHVGCRVSGAGASLDLSSTYLGYIFTHFRFRCADSVGAFGRGSDTFAQLILWLYNCILPCSHRCRCRQRRLFICIIYSSEIEIGTRKTRRLGWGRVAGLGLAA